MSVRFEFKYLISYNEYVLLKKNISFLLPKDKLNHSYPVLSLYYDSQDKEFYYQKINGEIRHFKMRARIYGQDFLKSENMWLEQKIKIGERQAKERKKMPTASIFQPKFWSSSTDKEVFREINQKKLHPSCFIYYNREAFELPSAEKKLRVTFDKGVSAFQLNQNFSQRKSVFDIVDNRNILMEIKYDNQTFPLFLQQILSSFSLKREYFSKYARGLETLELN